MLLSWVRFRRAPTLPPQSATFGERGSVTASPRHAGQATSAWLGDVDTLDDQLRNECEAMARYALRHGLAVAPDTIAELSRLINTVSGRAHDDDGNAVRVFAAIHRKLALAIAPARPQAVFLLDANYRHPTALSWLGPVPLIRLLSGAAIAFLLSVIGLGLSPEVSATNIDRGFLDSSGTSLLWNVLFLLCCAGLGAAFAALFQAHRYIAESTYDPKYDASYGARLILGLIAGLIIVELLPPEMFAKGSMHSFGKPALSMLGGFSGSAVYRLLQRLVDTLDALVRGDPSAGVQAMHDANRAQAAYERTQLQSELVACLVDLQQTLDAAGSPDKIKQQLAELMRKMLSADAVRLPALAARGAPLPGIATDIGSEITS